MMKTVIVCMLFTIVLSESSNNHKRSIVEYEEIRPIQRLPYIFRGDNVIIEPEPVISETYGNVIVPASTEVSTSFLSTAFVCILDVIQSSVYFLIANSPAMIVGGIIGLGVCKLTSLCSSEVTMIEVQRELTSYATPERLSRAAEFVREAIDKYNEIQKK